jgi:short-subunit dehydrogenase
LAIQYFLKEKKPGCIINTSSVYGLTGAPTAPLYAASKHAVSKLKTMISTRSLVFF